MLTEQECDIYTAYLRAEVESLQRWLTWLKEELKKRVPHHKSLRLYEDMAATQASLSAHYYNLLNPYVETKHD
jgi:predicted S18 family serine protease